MDELVEKLSRPPALPPADIDPTAGRVSTDRQARVKDGGLDTQFAAMDGYVASRQRPDERCAVACPPPGRHGQRDALLPFPFSPASASVGA